MSATSENPKLVTPSEVLPAAVEMSVADAYRELRQLQPGLAKIDWMTHPCPNCGHDDMVRRFSRKLDLEAWLVSEPLDVDGERVKDEPLAVAVIAILGVRPGADRAEVEDRLRRELAEAREECLA